MYFILFSNFFNKYILSIENYFSFEIFFKFFFDFYKKKCLKFKYILYYIYILNNVI